MQTVEVLQQLGGGGGGLRSEEKQHGLQPVRPFQREEGVDRGDEAEDTWGRGGEE